VGCSGDRVDGRQRTPSGYSVRAGLSCLGVNRLLASPAAMRRTVDRFACSSGLGTWESPPTPPAAAMLDTALGAINNSSLAAPLLLLLLPGRLPIALPSVVHPCASAGVRPAGLPPNNSRVAADCTRLRAVTTPRVQLVRQPRASAVHGARFAINMAHAQWARVAAPAAHVRHVHADMSAARRSSHHVAAGRQQAHTYDSPSSSPSQGRGVGRDLAQGGRSR
jgi:hypothetical protein